jgi:hypothetical protein
MSQRKALNVWCVHRVSGRLLLIVKTRKYFKKLSDGRIVCAVRGSDVQAYSL